MGYTVILLMLIKSHYIQSYSLNAAENKNQGQPDTRGTKNTKHTNKKGGR